MTDLVVLKVGGASTGGVGEAVATLRAGGARVVVVHGAGPQISSQMEARGIPVEFVHGRRVTTREGLEVVRESLEAVNAAVCAAVGRDAVGLAGDEVGLAATRIPELGYVGTPLPSRPPAVLATLAAGLVPVLSPLARGPLNVNADEAASALAVGIGAARIQFLTDVPGVFHEGELLSSIEAGRAESLIGEGLFEGGIVPKHLAAAHAARGGLVAEIALLPVYPPAPVTFVEGDGMWLTDADGRRYLDFASGIAVVGLGHRHPAPLAAAKAQLDRLWHVSNLFATEPAAALADRLSARFAAAAEGVAAVASSSGARAFFCNSGAEANEAALKYARKATGKPGVIALEQSFHGRTTGAVAVTGQPSKRAGFEPLLPGPRFAAANDVASLRAAASDDVGLILMEPVLGEGGVIPLEPAFAAAAAELAAELGALLAFDEVQTGVGRTGTFFGWERLGVKPHLATLAKGLANGLPIGCLLVSDDAPDGFAVGDHASTFGGNPVACAAGTAVCDTIDEALLAGVRENGARLAEGLRGLPGVVEVRGAGLLVGAELSGPAGPVVAAALEAGLVCLTSGANVLRLAPPLVASAADVDRALAILTEVTA